MELRLDQISVRIDSHLLVDSVDLRVGTGEILGLIGPNGSGKSTALRTAYRALAPAQGAVWLGGDDLATLSRREGARRVAALAQDGGVDIDFTVAELVALGRTPHHTGNQPLTAEEERSCWRAMERVEIEPLAHRGVGSLSGGERQRALVARALVQQAPILILDEPTNHLDMRHQQRLLSGLRGSGLTVLIVLHDLNLAAAACDRLAVLDHGRLVTQGTPEEVLTSTLVADIFGVQVAVVTHPISGRPQILFDLENDNKKVHV